MPAPRLLADLRDEIPGFDRARILSTAVTRDDWPPQRAVAGFDLPNGTPIANLWNPARARAGRALRRRVQ